MLELELKTDCIHDGPWVKNNLWDHNIVAISGALFNTEISIRRGRQRCQQYFSPRYYNGKPKQAAGASKNFLQLNLKIVIAACCKNEHFKILQKRLIMFQKLMMTKSMSITDVGDKSFDSYFCHHKNKFDTVSSPEVTKSDFIIGFSVVDLPENKV